MARLPRRPGRRLRRRPRPARASTAPRGCRCTSSGARSTRARCWPTWPGTAREGAATYRKELAWREFYADVLFARPETAREYLRPGVREDGVRRARPTTLDAWREGRTGFPVVDAGMRQLRATGWMHNRVRMIVASFLVKDLHLEWQHGARHFMQLAGRRRPGLQPARLAVDGRLRHRRVAVLPGLQPDQPGPEVRPGRRLRPALGARAGRRRRPARPLPGGAPAGGLPRSPSSTTPRSAARRSTGGRGSGDERPRPPLIVPRRFCGPASSGNGGWTAGALAALVPHDCPDNRARSWPTIRVALRQPPPLDTPMAVGRARTARRWPSFGGVRGRPGDGRRRGAHHGRRGPGRRGACGDGGVPRPRLAPLPHLLRLRHRARRGRRAADLPRPGRRPGRRDPDRGRPGRRTRASARTSTRTSTSCRARRSPPPGRRWTASAAGRATSPSG